MKIYTIGIGKDGTMLYPPDQFGFKRPVQLVGIDEDSLREIADKTGGKYFRAESADALRAVYKEIDLLEKLSAKNNASFNTTISSAPFRRSAGVGAGPRFELYR